MKNVNEEFVKACFEGRVSQASILLKHGADVDAVDRHGKTALFWAVKNKNIEMIELLTYAGAKICNMKKLNENLLKNCEKGNIEETELLIEAGADVNFVDEDDYTPLMIASSCGHIEIVKLLIDNGANVNYFNRYSYGNTSLMIASYHGDIELAKLLIDKGAYVNAFNEDGINALIWAVRNKDFEMIKLLIDAGAEAEA